MRPIIRQTRDIIRYRITLGHTLVNWSYGPMIGLAINSAVDRRQCSTSQEKCRSCGTCKAELMESLKVVGGVRHSIMDEKFYESRGCGSQYDEWPKTQRGEISIQLFLSSCWERLPVTVGSLRINASAGEPTNRLQPCRSQTKMASQVYAKTMASMKNGSCYLWRGGTKNWSSR